MPTQTQTQAEAEAQVRSWGYNHVFTWTDRPYAHYPPHSHKGPTTHLILAGTLEMRYADDDSSAISDEPAQKKTLGRGDRWDVEAGRVHEVWVGEGGCRYVIGE